MCMPHTSTVITLWKEKKSKANHGHQVNIKHCYMWFLEWKQSLKPTLASSRSKWTLDNQRNLYNADVRRRFLLKIWKQSQRAIVVVFSNRELLVHHVAIKKFIPRISENSQTILISWDVNNQVLIISMNLHFVHSKNIPCLRWLVER